MVPPTSRWGQARGLVPAGKQEANRNMANQLGRRYQCEVCGSTVLCTKAGEGVIQCHEKEMAVQQPRKLPSSD